MPITTEDQLSEAFTRLETKRDASMIGLFRVCSVGHKSRLRLGYHCNEKSRSLIFPLNEPEVVRRDLPDSDRMTVATLPPSADTDKTFLIFRPLRHCRAKTFLRTAFSVIETMQEIGSTASASDFLDAVDEWMFGRSAPPPFPYSAQAGLMGELTVLENDLLPYFSARNAIESWKGPYGAEKDFDLPDCCIEAKATKSSTDLSFWVNGEDQFVQPEAKPMLLSFAVFDRSPDNSETVRQIVERLQKHPNLSKDTDALSKFNRTVKKAGYNSRHRDRYKLAHFALKERLYFRINAVFPCLRVEHVRHELDASFLAEIEYAIAVSALKTFDCKRGIYIGTIKNSLSRQKMTKNTHIGSEEFGSESLNAH